MNATLVSLLGTLGAAAARELVPLAKSGELADILRASKAGSLLGLARVPVKLAIAPAIGLFGAGAAVGLAAGVLLAPKEGAAMRQALMESASDLVRRIRGAPEQTKVDPTPPSSAEPPGDKLLS